MSHENVEIVRRFYEAFNERNLEEFLAQWAPDAEWRPALIGGGIIEGAVYRGHQGLGDFLDVQDEAWATVTATPLAVRDLGDSVLAEVRLDAVGRAGSVPVERITWTLFMLDRGKIRDGCVYLTEREALEAVGLAE